MRREPADPWKVTTACWVDTPVLVTANEKGTCGPLEGYYSWLDLILTVLVTANDKGTRRPLESNGRRLVRYFLSW